MLHHRLFECYITDSFHTFSPSENIRHARNVVHAKLNCAILLNILVHIYALKIVNNLKMLKESKLELIS